ncbi:MAG: hypothetical protein OXH02_03655 [Gemmatimonadetes bacterium]|nr:hypothetical protein [Gemmatimonadota bacterium]
MPLDRHRDEGPRESCPNTGFARSDFARETSSIAPPETPSVTPLEPRRVTPPETPLEPRR